MWNAPISNNYIHIVDQKNVMAVLTQAMLRHYKKLKEIQKRAGHSRAEARGAVVKGFKGVETNFPTPFHPTKEVKHVVRSSDLQLEPKKREERLNPASLYHRPAEEEEARTEAPLTIVIKPPAKKLSKREKDHLDQVKRDNRRLVKNLEVIGNTYGE